ncbi:MAG: CdaR family transcriptional regulator [Chitinophagales bacterium]
MLNQELAATIAARTMEVLGKNINLMDTRGVIIASGDPVRVGNFHEGAAQALRLGRRVEITQEKQEVMSGVRPGINLPIRLNNNVVGVVGITGDPNEVRVYAELVRITVELMLEQALQKEKIETEYYMREALVRDLVTGRSDGDQELFKLRAYGFGIKLDQPMVALVIGVDRFNEKPIKGREKSNPQLSEQILLRRLRKTVVEAIQAVIGDLDLASFVNENIFVVLKRIELDREEKTLSQDLIRQASRIEQQILVNTGYRTRIGVGSYHPGLDGPAASFREGMSALHLGQACHDGCSIYYIKDLALETLIAERRGEARSEYIRQVLGPLFNDKEYGKEHLHMLDQLFAHHCRLAETAESLHLHRNTLRLRMARVKRLTGLDPAHWPDAATLYTALLCYKIDSIVQDAQNSPHKN